jgi:hypothetical protein
MLHQAPLVEGATGGALLDEHGALVGFNMDIDTEGSAEPPRLGKAVTSSYLADALTELRPGANGLYGGWEERHGCHHQMASLAGQVREASGVEGSGHDMEDMESDGGHDAHDDAGMEHDAGMHEDR